MRLYIAEKPSLGRAIAEALPKPHSKQEGFIRVGNGDVVSWCVGHLLELAEPDAYNSDFKKWRLEHLPIVPDTWKMQPKANTKKQLSVLKKLIKQADELVHVGDPDREGQLLVDEVIDYVGIAQKKRNDVKRCLISDLNTSAVRKALGRLQQNREFEALSLSALARSRADWLYGINMTRVCTIQGRKTGFNSVLSVGRVQTPLLGLVVRRDQDIAAFVPKPYFEVDALLETDCAQQFKAKWQPSDACQPYQDEDGRVVFKKLAENVISRITGQPGDVKAVVRQRKKQAAPLPYNLSSLQIDAAKRYGMSAKHVLDSCQQLYEKHQLITYPRSDCRYLPTEHWREAVTVSEAIATVCQPLQPVIIDADFQRRSKVWNDTNIQAHHAIIPTQKKVDASRLSDSEKKIYELVARQYLAQFYPPWVFDQRQIEVSIQGGLFVAKAKQTIEQGWKALFKRSDSNDEQSLPTVLPDVKKGDVLMCLGGELLEKLTTPPKHFTDASLLSAMTGIARFVADPAVKKILKETDGLGTEATRASIIELLFKRGFLTRKGKQIHATDTGKMFIASLPEAVSMPDMTAQWESELNAICQHKASYEGFMLPMQASLQPLIKGIGPTSFSGLKSVEKTPRRSFNKRKGFRKRSKSKVG